MRKLFLLLSITLSTVINAQQINYRSPLDIPLVLSANFGELRPNHFHSGIDLKTQGVINKPVYSIEDGYISRISISPAGYGWAVYVDHPTTGHTSVYGHLNNLAPKLLKVARSEQYSQESFRVDFQLTEDILPVTRGEQIAMSGNTGGSGGPHVHFELRDTKTEIVIDPLPYFRTRISDGVSPEVRGIAVYPMEGKGTVNNGANPFRENITKRKDGSIIPLKKIEAWGEIGVGIHAIDRMTGTANIYGVKEVRLYCNDDEIFYSDISSIDFSTSRMINSFTDFDYWSNTKRFFMKSFVEPGNKLHIYNTKKGGYINIDEEKTYKLRYELKDLHGNATNYDFTIEGRKMEIPQQPACSLVMKHDENNRYISEHFTLIIPKGYLYKDVNFLLQREDSEKYMSQIYKVHHSSEPINAYVDMSLQLQVDTLLNKSQYGIVSLKKGKEQWVGGKYNEGYITVGIRELGNQYAVTSDKQAPTITPVTPNTWLRDKKITIRLSDNLSGIASFRGTINGEYVLFEHDIKSPNYTYKFDDSRLQKGKNSLEFKAIDGADNVATYNYTFTY